MIVHLTTWTETAVLAYFWDVVRDGADKRDALRQIASVAISRPADWDKTAIREGADAETKK